MVNKKSRLTMFVAGSFFLHAAIATIALTSNLPQKNKNLAATEIEMATVEMATPVGLDDITAGQVVVKEEPVAVVEVAAPAAPPAAVIPEPAAKPKVVAAKKPAVLPPSKNKPAVETQSLNETPIENSEPVVTLIPESQSTSAPVADLEPVPETTETVEPTAPVEPVEAVPVPVVAADPVNDEKAEMLEAAKAWKGEEEAPASETPAASETGVSNSTGESTTAVAPPSEGLVRSFEQLRAKPGNKRPSYDAEERRKGLQGEVTFLAYVTPTGTLSNFKMVQSTGHRSLDLKSLGAIKTWKFQGGQEGWVEIPLHWKLEGGPQVAPSVLRRKVSQN